MGVGSAFLRSSPARAAAPESEMPPRLFGLFRRPERLAQRLRGRLRVPAFASLRMFPVTRAMADFAMPRPTSERTLSRMDSSAAAWQADPCKMRATLKRAAIWLFDRSVRRWGITGGSGAAGCGCDWALSGAWASGIGGGSAPPRPPSGA